MKKTILWLLLSAMAVSPSAGKTDKDIFSNIEVSMLTVRADKEVSDKWSYSECLEWALSNNTDLRRTLLSILQSDQDILQAKDAWLPTVEFSSGQGYTNLPIGKEGNNHNVYNSSYGVNGAWTVWEGNVRKYRLQSAELVRRQQRFAGEDVIKDLQLGVLQAYLDILYAREAIEIARQTLEVSSAQTERMRKLVDAGRQSKVDLAQLESQEAQDKYNLTQAKTNLASVKMTMKKLLSLGLNDDIEIQDVEFSDKELSIGLPQMGSVFESAIGWLPSFKENAVSKEIYATDVKIAEATSSPNVALQAGVGTGFTTGGRDWGYQMGHRLNENINLTLSVPIYDGNSRKRAVAKARLAEIEAEISREQLLNDLSQTIEQLYIEARNATSKYESGAVQLDAMQLTSQLVDRQFELGLVNPLELLTAHNNLLNARLEQLQNKYMAILAVKTIGFYASGEVDMP